MSTQSTNPHFFTTFARNAAITVNQTLTHKERLANFALGLVDESVELFGSYFDGYKFKTQFNSSQNSFEDTKLEIGDVSWYICNLQAQLGIQGVSPYALDQLTIADNMNAPSSYEDGIRNRLVGVLSNAKDAGELVKKHLFHGNLTEDDIRKDVAESLQNVVFCLSDLCLSSGFTYQSCLEATIHKLQKRYPERFEAYVLKQNASQQLPLFGG